MQKYTDQPARQEVILAACIGFSEELFSRGDRSDSMELCKKMEMISIKKNKVEMKSMQKYKVEMNSMQKYKVEMNSI